MGQNLVSTHLEDAQWDGVDQAIDVVEERLAPILIRINAAQRRRLAKMGDGSQAFCNKAHAAARLNRPLLPASLDIEEMGRDLRSHDALSARLTRLSTLMAKLRDTETALGSDVMVAALATYHFLKAAGGEGLDEVNRELGKRFEDNGKRVDEPAKA